MRSRHLLHAVCCIVLAAPLGACSFDKYDGRWVANVAPTAKCCPMRVVMDVDTHKFTGSVEDCDGAQVLSGHVNGKGDATLHMHGQNAEVHFGDVNFTTSMPNDRCHRPIVGNRGG
jgi:hypothetical protein